MSKGTEPFYIGVDEDLEEVITKKCPSEAEAKEAVMNQIATVEGGEVFYILKAVKRIEVTVDAHDYPLTDKDQDDAPTTKV